MIQLPMDYSAAERSIARHLTFRALDEAVLKALHSKRWFRQSPAKEVATALQSLNTSLQYVPIKELVMFVREWRRNREEQR